MNILISLISVLFFSSVQAMEVSTMHEQYIKNYLLDIIATLKVNSGQENNISLNGLDTFFVSIEDSIKLDCSLVSERKINLFKDFLDSKNKIDLLLNKLKELIATDILSFNVLNNENLFQELEANPYSFRIAFRSYIIRIYAQTVFELKQNLSEDGLNKIINLLESSEFLEGIDKFISNINNIVNLT